jgi:hypothetical protein
VEFCDLYCKLSIILMVARIVSGYSNYRIRTYASNQDPDSVGLVDPDFESGPRWRNIVLERVRSVHPH